MKALKNIYLDYQATTPVDRRVVDKRVLPYFGEVYGNPHPGTTHLVGKRNKSEMARENVAK